MPYRSLENRYLASRRSAGLPVITYLAIMGFALIALLFIAGATMEIHKPANAGLPTEVRRSHYDLDTSAPAPAPDMNSQAVLEAQPNSEPDPLMKLHPDARAARAEAPVESNPVTRPSDRQQNHYRENPVIDRFSIGGQ